MADRNRQPPPDEAELTAQLARLIEGWRSTPELAALTAALQGELHGPAAAEPFVGRPLPPELLREPLPQGVASAWVFVLRPGTRNPAHYHPNSTQRTAVLAGTGSCFIGDAEQVLEPFDLRRAADTLVTFPDGTPHAFLPGAEPLVVLSFHSVVPEELIEIEVHGHRTRTYVG
jgi:quercetin dioxygenase-like cupin family protein